MSPKFEAFERTAGSGKVVRLDMLPEPTKTIDNSHFVLLSDLHKAGRKRAPLFEALQMTGEYSQRYGKATTNHMKASEPTTGYWKSCPKVYFITAY